MEEGQGSLPLLEPTCTFNTFSHLPPCTGTLCQCLLASRTHTSRAACLWFQGVHAPYSLLRVALANGCSVCQRGTAVVVFGGTAE